MNNKKIKIILLLLFFLAFNLLIRWNSFSSPFERDEGEYAYSATLLLNGGKPYIESFLQKPPVIIYLYSIALFFSHSVVSVRFISFLFTLITLGSGYKFIKLHFKNELAAIFSLFVGSVFLAFPYFMGLSSNTEIFMNAFLIIMLLFLEKAKDSKKIRYIFFAGFFAALSFFAKQISMYFIGFVILYYLYDISYKHKHLVVDFFYISLGFILSTFLIFLPFLLNGSIEYIYESAFLYNLYYARTWGWGIGNLLKELGIILNHLGIVLFPLIYFFYLQKNKFYYLFIILTIILAIFQTPIGHYYLFLMMYLYILASVGLAYIFEKSGSYKIFVFPVFLLIILYPIRTQFGMTPDQINLWIYGNENPFYEAPLVAEKLKSITKEGDKVFIAGSEPEILFYANRKSMSRFVITYPFIIDTPVRLKYQHEGITEFGKKLPKAIVYSRRDFSGLWNKESPMDFINYLDNLIKNKYTLEGAYVWSGKGGQWLETPQESELKYASLILYKLK